MDIGAYLTAFLATPSGLAVKGLLVASLLVFALGVAAALRDGTFAWAYIDSFVRSILMGRVVPVLLVLVIGYASREDAVTAVGVVAAGAVATGMLAGALDSIRQLAMHPSDSARKNARPTA